MSMLNLKELDSMHLSVLAEIGNIGSGNAATALAGLLNTPADIWHFNIYRCIMPKLQIILVGQIKLLLV